MCMIKMQGDLSLPEARALRLARYARRRHERAKTAKAREFWASLMGLCALRLSQLGWGPERLYMYDFDVLSATRKQIADQPEWWRMPRSRGLEI